jgi:hypothetical protein
MSVECFVKFIWDILTLYQTLWSAFLVSNIGYNCNTELYIAFTQTADDTRP